MSNVKSKASHRLLAALLSIVMVFSMIPFSTMVAHAATAEHPNVFTVSVVDEDGQAIKDATVKLTFTNIITNQPIILTKTTDEYGVAEEDISDFFADGEFKVSAVVTADGYADGTLAETDVLTAEDNFVVTLESNTIKDVNISGKTLTYDGNEQELVLVTEVEGDTVEYYLNGATDPVTEVPTAKDAGTWYYQYGSLLSENGD